MYDKKIFLYFALTIVGFLLWNAWQKDYGPKPPATTVQQQGTMPLPSVTSTNSSSSLPLEAPESAKVDRIVNIKTDTLDIQIDRLGGNIISLKLPQYPVAYETPNVPVTLLANQIENYYVARTGVVGKGIDSTKVLFESTSPSYQLSFNQNELSIDLNGKAEGIVIKKTYVFKRGKYDISLSQTVTNQGKEAWNGQLFWEITRRGLSDENSFFGLHTYRGAAISSPQNPYEKISFSKMDKENLNVAIKDGWAAMQQRYFATAWVPSTNEILNYYSHYLPVGPTDKAQDRLYTIGFKTSQFNLLPNSALTFNTKLYSGPEIADLMKQVAPHLDLLIDFGWLWIFSVPIFKLMQFIYGFVHNWGLAIILVTVLIKLLFFKLSETSYRSMARMRHLQPKLLALKDKYGEDRQKLSQATMELYRKEKVNPLGGCLPMIVQIPVFIALYYVLIESVELRQAPFIWWIHDLSVKDPYYVLPILMGLSWMWQQKLNPPPPDPMQAKIMMLFPIIFTVLFATFPAGLVLYWIVSNCLSILQQWYIMRKVEIESKQTKPLAKAKKLKSE